MAKLFNGKVSFGFAFNQTGAQPLDDRSVVQSYAELLKAETFGTAIYNGMTVATVDEQKVYMLVDKTKATYADGWKEIGGAVSVNTYAEAVALASDENIGQVIYVKTKSSYDADGEGEGAAVEYDAAPYIVIGARSLQKLAASTASGDIEGDVAELKTKVSGIETTVGNAEGGLVKDVADLKSAVDALPETFVTDVKDASGNSVVVDGVVTLGDYATKTEVNNGLAEKVDSSDYEAKMLQVDASIAEKADASNVYTKDEVDSSFVKSEDYIAFSQDEKDKLASINAGAEVNYIKSVGDNLAVDDKGKLTVTIPEVEVPEYNIVKLDTAEDGYASSYQLQKDGVGVGASINIPKDMVVSSGEVRELADGEITDERPQGVYVVLTLSNTTNDKLYIPANKLVDDYTGSAYVAVASNGVISIKYDDLKSALQADFDSVYDASGAAAAVEGKLNEYKTSNNVAVAAKVDSSDYTAKVTEIDGSILAIKASIANVYTKTEVDGSLALKANVADVYDSSTVDNLLVAKVDSSVYDAKVAEIDSSISSINAEIAKKADASTVESALDGKVDKVEGSSLVDNTLITKLGNMVEIKSVSGDLTFADGALSLDLSRYAKSADVVAKEEGKGLSTNDFTDVLLAKLNGIAEGAEVNYVKSVGDNLAVDDKGELTVDLSALATSQSVAEGLATKLDASAKVNGVSFTNGEATLTAGNIALGAKISPTVEKGAQFDESKTIIEVLTSISNRIDSLDPTVDGEYGVAEVTGGNGIAVDGTKTNPQISVKISAEAGNMITADASGVYVSDMRSYWEAI
jgi:hypothetical protein